MGKVKGYRDGEEIELDESEVGWPTDLTLKGNLGTIEERIFDALQTAGVMTKAQTDQAKDHARGPPNTPSGPEGPEAPEGETRRGPRAGHRAGGKRAPQKGKGAGVRKVAPVKKRPRRKAADLPAKRNRRR
jgi:hypothetical protein